MNEAILLQEASGLLATRLPAGWKQRVTRLRAGPQGRPAAMLDVTGPDGARARLSVAAKSGLVPRIVTDLKTRLRGYFSDPSLVISPFLTRSTRDRLRAEQLKLSRSDGQRPTRPFAARTLRRDAPGCAGADDRRECENALPARARFEAK